MPRIDVEDAPALLEGTALVALGPLHAGVGPDLSDGAQHRLGGSATTLQSAGLSGGLKR